MSDPSFRCGRYVVRQIHQLLGADPGNPSPVSRALLAQLRQAESKEPGTVPSVWPITHEGLPDDLGEVELQRVERAIHVALTQFAVHQQSRSAAMHTTDRSFGSAVRILARNSNAEEPHETPVYRRFTAMATSTSLPALLAHSRGIITQLRGEDIGFDYGRYADDLYYFQVPSTADSVRRRWGRDFHHLRTHTTDISTETEGA